MRDEKKRNQNDEQLDIKDFYSDNISPLKKSELFSKAKRNSRWLEGTEEETKEERIKSIDDPSGNHLRFKKQA